VTVFNVTGATLETIDPNGNTTVNTLDGHERTVKVKDPLGNVSSIAVDPAGLVLSSTDGNGKVSRYQYNKDTERTTTIDPNGHQSETVFNSLGQQEKGTGYFYFDAGRRNARAWFNRRPCLHASRLGSARQVFWNRGRSKLRSRRAGCQKATSGTTTPATIIRTPTTIVA
jgi:YD repeat-containing protein